MRIRTNKEGLADWLDIFAKEYAKTTKNKSAVEAARERTKSIHEQISSIMGVSGHTVESKVKELQDRTGLTEYLKRFASTEETKEMFAKFSPKMRKDLKNTIYNIVSSNRGNIEIPAVQHELLALFKQYGLRPEDVNEVSVFNYINNKIVKELKINPPNKGDLSQLGKIDYDLNEDDDDSDFFKGMMPSS